jgi:hypothetical protein
VPGRQDHTAGAALFPGSVAQKMPFLTLRIVDIVSEKIESLNL